VTGQIVTRRSVATFPRTTARALGGRVASASEFRWSSSRRGTRRLLETQHPSWSGSKSLLFRHHGAPAGAELLIRNSSKFRAPTMRRRRPPCSIRRLLRRRLLDHRGATPLRSSGGYSTIGYRPSSGRSGRPGTRCPEPFEVCVDFFAFAAFITQDPGCLQGVAPSAIGADESGDEELDHDASRGEVGRSVDRPLVNSTHIRSLVRPHYQRHVNAALRSRTQCDDLRVTSLITHAGVGSHCSAKVST
jgi:hypothetical protein